MKYSIRLSIKNQRKILNNSRRGVNCLYEKYKKGTHIEKGY